MKQVSEWIIFVKFKRSQAFFNFSLSELELSIFMLKSPITKVFIFTQSFNYLIHFFKECLNISLGGGLHIRGREGESERGRERETERARERESEREGERQTDRQRQTETERQRDRDRERQRETKRDRQTDRQTGRQTDRQTDRQSNSAFNEGEDSLRELEEEVVCLFFISGVIMSFNNSGVSGKGVLVYWKLQ